MGKKRVAVLGSIGKSILIDDSLSARVAALEAALAALRRAGPTQKHSALQGLQVGNDHPQYPLKLARETIKGQWDFTKQVWASFGTEAAPGYAFTQLTNTGMWAEVASGDPQFNNVVLLMRASDAGAAGSTALVDVSQYARPLANVTGIFEVSATVSKFGGTSLKSVNSTGYVSFDDSAAPELQEITTAKYWCQEGWVNIATGVGGNFIQKSTFSTLFPSIAEWVTGNQLRWRGDDNVGAYNITSPASFPGLQWVHLALVRDNDQFIMFFDGIEVIRTSWSGDLANQLGGGRLWSVGGFNGVAYFDQVRWTMNASDPDAARYHSNFTPPTAAFSSTAGDTFLGFSVLGDEKIRFANMGQLGIGGANYGTSRQSLLSGGPTAAPSWATLVHTDVSDWDEAVQDVVGAMVVDSASINFTYDDTLGTLTGAVVPATFLTETDETAAFPTSRQLVAGTGITFSTSISGEFEISSSGGGGGSGGPVARIYSTGTQNFTTSVEAAVNFTMVQYDDDAMFDIGTPSRLTAPAGADGWYSVVGSLQWAATTGGVRRLAIRVNGADLYNTSSTNSPSDANSPFSHVSALVPLHENDYVELMAYQDQGGTVATVANTAMLAAARMFADAIAGPDDPPVSPDAMDDEFSGSSLDAKWTWRNQNLAGGTAQADATVGSGVCLLESGSTAASPLVQAIGQPFTGTARFRCKMAPTTPNNFNIVGLFLRDSVSGKSIGLGNHHNGSGQRRLVSKWNSDTSFNSGPFEDANAGYPTANYVEIEVDATTAYFRWSTDGVNFTTLFSELVASFIGTPDTILLGVVTFSGGNRANESVEWFRRFA